MNFKTIRQTNGLRWYYPNGINGPKILQQAWDCIEDGSIEWKDIPLEIPKIEFKTQST